MFAPGALSSIFRWVVYSSAQVSVLVCLILVVQVLLRRRMARRWHYALWFLLLVRMIMPWAPESRLSVFNLFPFTQQRSVVLDWDGLASAPTIAAPLVVSSSEALPRGEALTATQDVPKPTWNWRRIRQAVFYSKAVPMVWLIGVTVLVAYGLIDSLALSLTVRREPALTDAKVLQLLEKCQRQMRVRTVLTIIQSSRVRSPSLFGFIRPRLLLPQGTVETLDHDELRYVFLHELAHLKRRDIAVNLVAAVLQAVHWFNPLIWYAFYRMRTDREIACDSLVLSRTKADEARHYGRTMVHTLERFSQPRRMPTVVGILEDRSVLKRRITMIAQFKKSPYRWSVLAVAVFTVLTCVALTDARQPAEETAANVDQEMAAESTSANDPVVDQIDLPSEETGYDAGQMATMSRDRVVSEPPASEQTVASNAQEASSPELHADLSPAQDVKESALEVEEDASGAPTGRVSIAESPPVRTKEESSISKIKRIEQKLNKPVTLIFEEGADIGALIEFLSDVYDVNIVLDERVMTPRPGAPTVPRKPRGKEGEGEEEPSRWIPPAIPREIGGIHLEDVPLKDALKTILAAMGLAYKVQPEFIWISTPYVLRYETFEPLDTRYYLIQHAEAKEILSKLRAIVPQIMNLDTGEVLSHMHVVPGTNLLIVHNTASNLQTIENFVERFDRPTASRERQSEVKKYLDRGVKLYEEARYRDALECFSRALVLDPDNATALKYADECKPHLKPGPMEERVVEYPVKTLSPDSAGPSPEEVRERVADKYLRLGQEHFDKHQYDKAIMEWERVLLVDPENEVARKSIRDAKRRTMEKKREKETQGGTVQAAEAGLPAATRHALIGDSPPIITDDEPTTSKMNEIEEKLEKEVTIIFEKGKDIRAVLSFLAKLLDVKIVLDERVMLRRDSVSPTPLEPGISAKRYGVRAPVDDSIVREIAASVPPELGEIRLINVPLKDALQVILKQMGLHYKVQPEFIWVSTPYVLRHETFEELETRYYSLAGVETRERLLADLRTVTPEVIDFNTREVLSYISALYLDRGQTTPLIAIHNIPSNLKLIEEFLENQVRSERL